MNYGTESGSFAAAITPSDVTVLTPTQKIWVGVAGNITVRMYKQQNLVTFSNVPVGWLEVQVDQVRSTSTTATTMIAVW